MIPAPRTKPYAANPLGDPNQFLPVRQQPVQVQYNKPTGYENNTAAYGNFALQFLEGLQKGRAQAYERDHQEQTNRIRTMQSELANVLDNPDIMPQDKENAKNLFQTHVQALYKQNTAGADKKHPVMAFLNGLMGDVGGSKSTGTNPADPEAFHSTLANMRANAVPRSQQIAQAMQGMQQRSGQLRETDPMIPMTEYLADPEVGKHYSFLVSQGVDPMRDPRFQFPMVSQDPLEQARFDAIRQQKRQGIQQQRNAANAPVEQAVMSQLSGGAVPPMSEAPAQLGPQAGAAPPAVRPGAWTSNPLLDIDPKPMQMFTPEGKPVQLLTVKRSGDLQNYPLGQYDADTGKPVNLAGLSTLKPDMKRIVTPEQANSRLVDFFAASKPFMESKLVSPEAVKADLERYKSAMMAGDYEQAENIRKTSETNWKLAEDRKYKAEQKYEARLAAAGLRNADREVRAGTAAMQQWITSPAVRAQQVILNIADANNELAAKLRANPKAFDNGAADQALVSGLAKILDPSTGVLNGEYLRLSQSTGNLAAPYIANAKALLDGGSATWTPQQRRAALNVINSIAQSNARMMIQAGNDHVNYWKKLGAPIEVGDLAGMAEALQIAPGLAPGAPANPELQNMQGSQPPTSAAPPAVRPGVEPPVMFGTPASGKKNPYRP